MLIGQNPGFNEGEWGKPFVGQAGQYLDSLLFQSGIARDSVYITNLIKCLTPNNRELQKNEISACAKWLDIELSMVRPEIIVAMGAPAIARFLPGYGSVEHVHGKPIEQDGRIILPCYHPAAALYDTALMRHCQDDFQVLRGLTKGAPVSDYHVRDEYPHPDYRVVDTPEKVAEMTTNVEGAGEFAVDTEQCRGASWSVQISCQPGTAYFTLLPDNYRGRVDLASLKAQAIVHYYLHDIQYVNLANDRFVDTMVMAYLLGLPQGLKELASRLCGINMVNYNEMVRPGQRELSMMYLLQAGKTKWPDPPPIEETKWDNKKGEIVTRVKKPWHISRKIEGLLNSVIANSDIDLYQRWHDIPEAERSVVEEKMGSMPEASLKDVKLEDAIEYACRDADATLRVSHKLRKMISDMGLDFILRMDTDILPMVDSMMATGMAVDLDHLRKLSADYDVRMRAKSFELAGLVGHSFNPNSSHQVAAVVYGELGFKPTRFTPTKEISTDDQELKKTGHPVAKGVIEYRRMSKMKGTYADALVEWARPDENGVPRVHTTLKTTRVGTGRLSSSDPNLQNIPTRTEESKAVKSSFIAPSGKRLGEGDLAQIEVCTQAHLADCKGLIDLFLSGKDPHTTTASSIFGVSYEEAKQEKYRYPTKRANFGVIYMIGAEGLSAQIGEYIADLQMAGEKVEVDPWSVEDCNKFITEWYKLYPEVKDYQMEMAAMARRYGYVRDMFGRIRYIPEVTCPIRSIQEAGLRMAANMPVTASAQGIIKLAMGSLWQQLPSTEWANDVRFLMQIHDSLIVEVTDDEAILKPYFRWMSKIMTGVVKLLVPIRVDFKIGKRWGEMKKISLDEEERTVV